LGDEVRDHVRRDGERQALRPFRDGCIHADEIPSSVKQRSVVAEELAI